MAEIKETFKDKVEDDFMYDFALNGKKSIKDYLVFKQQQLGFGNQKATLTHLLLKQIEKDEGFKEFLEHKK